MVKENLYCGFWCDTNARVVLGWQLALAPKLLFYKGLKPKEAREPVLPRLL